MVLAQCWIFLLILPFKELSKAGRRGLFLKSSMVTDAHSNSGDLGRHTDQFKSA